MEPEAAEADDESSDWSALVGRGSSFATAERMCTGRKQSAKTAGLIEKERAQVQTDIEAVTAQRDNLRTRTDMVRIEISYVGAAGQIGGADLTPDLSGR